MKKQKNEKLANKKNSSQYEFEAEEEGTAQQEEAE